MLEPLELVEDDQVGFERVHADAGKLIAKRPDRISRSWRSSSGRVLPFARGTAPAGPSNCSRKPGLPAFVRGRIVMTRERLPELLDEAFDRAARDELA